MRKTSQATLFPASLLTCYVIASTLIPFDFAPNWHDQQRIVQAVFLLISGSFAVWVFAAKTSGYSLQIWPIWIFAALGALSAIASPLPQWAWTEWRLMVCMVLGTILIAGYVESQDATLDRTLMGAIWLVCALIMLQFCSNYIAAAAAGGPLDTRELSALAFTNRRFFGQLQTLTLPLVASLPLLTSSRAKVAAILTLVCWWMLAFVSATRGTFFGVAGAALVVAIRYRAASLFWLRSLGTGLLAGAASFWIMFIAVPGLLGLGALTENRFEDIASSSGRVAVWHHALELILAHPLLGVGPMHFAYFRDVAVPVAHPHNSLLQIAAEWGIPAVLAIGIYAALGMVRYLKAPLSSGNAPIIRMALIASVIAGATQSLVDGVIVMPVPQTLLMLISAWALGFHLRSALLRCPAPKKRRHLAVAFVALPLAAWNLTTALQGLPGLSDRLARFEAAHGRYTHPRYWQQGWIDPMSDAQGN